MSCFDLNVTGAPIRRDGASPLRAATGGNASSGSAARCRRAPAPANPTARVGYLAGRWVANGENEMTFGLGPV